MSDLDNLMDIDPLALSARDLDALIVHYRERRAAPKGKARKDTGGPSVDLVASGILDGLIGKSKQQVVRRR